ncbi:MAG: cytidine deaminase [Sulfobacillus sp.]|nr:cytidine deaminase [Sulfobacillus sp.]
MDRLLRAARQVRQYAYAPYSGFRVGAALETDDGTVITGVNVENASYPLGCCAERAALYTAVGQGYRRFVRIAVVGPGPRPVPPCGGCRQALAEFGDLTVIMATPDETGPIETRGLHELLPHQFGAELGAKEEPHGL